MLGAQYVSGPAPPRLLGGHRCGRGHRADARSVGRAAEAALRDQSEQPDGSITARADLLRLLDLPVVVVVDEAYIDFSTQQSLAPLVPERRT
jgi:histidinol-phosphate aminotransferase